MDGFSRLIASLRYIDSTQEVKWNSLHAGIGKNEGIGSGIIDIMYINVTFFLSLH